MRQQMQALMSTRGTFMSRGPEDGAEYVLAVLVLATDGYVPAVTTCHVARVCADLASADAAERRVRVVGPFCLDRDKDGLQDALKAARHVAEATHLLVWDGRIAGVRAERVVAWLRALEDGDVDIVSVVDPEPTDAPVSAIMSAFLQGTLPPAAMPRADALGPLNLPEFLPQTASKRGLFPVKACATHLLCCPRRVAQTLADDPLACGPVVHAQTSKRLSVQEAFSAAVQRAGFRCAVDLMTEVQCCTVRATSRDLVASLQYIHGMQVQPQSGGGNCVDASQPPPQDGEQPKQNGPQ